MVEIIGVDLGRNKKCERCGGNRSRKGFKNHKGEGWSLKCNCMTLLFYRTGRVAVVMRSDRDLYTRELGERLDCHD